jgi:hypothetical protein
MKFVLLACVLCFGTVTCLSGCGSGDATVLSAPPVNPPSPEELAAKEREMEKH